MGTDSGSGLGCLGTQKPNCEKGGLVSRGHSPCLLGGTAPSSLGNPASWTVAPQCCPCALYREPRGTGHRHTALLGPEVRRPAAVTTGWHCGLGQQLPPACPSSAGVSILAQQAALRTPMKRHTMPFLLGNNQTLPYGDEVKTARGGFQLNLYPTGTAQGSAAPITPTRPPEPARHGARGSHLQARGSPCQCLCSGDWHQWAALLVPTPCRYRRGHLQRKQCVTSVAWAGGVTRVPGSRSQVEAPGPACHPKRAAALASEPSAQDHSPRVAPLWGYPGVNQHNSVVT